MALQLLKISVHRGYNDFVSVSVTARNANGEIIIGNTGLVDRASVGAEIDAIVGALDALQTSVSNPQTKTPATTKSITSGQIKA